jgi:hypothetical protein
METRRTLHERKCRHARRTINASLTNLFLLI